MNVKSRVDTPTLKVVKSGPISDAAISALAELLLSLVEIDQAESRLRKAA